MGSSVILPTPGQPTQGPDPGFKNASKALQGTYKITDMSPPTPYYLTQDDVITIQTNSSAAVSPSVAWRYLDVVTGQVRFGGQQLNILGTRTQQQFNFILGEVFLLELSLFLGQTGFNRGRTFINATVVRNAQGGAGGINAGVLFQDYLPAEHGLAWPGGPMRQSVEGPGWLHSQNVANPAAGADWTFVVPAVARAAVRSFSAVFTASATVATRNVELILDDGANVMWRTSLPAGITASQVATVSAAQTNVPTGVVTLDLSAVIPPGLVMSAGWRLRTLTGNIQVGDQWSAIWLNEEEWIEP